MNSKNNPEVIYTVNLSNSGVLVLRPQKQLKGKPRGRPWPKGVSGNPAGRRKGVKNIFSQMVLAAAKANASPLKDINTLDSDYPALERGIYYFQRGRRFFIDTKKAVPGPLPDPPERLDRRRQWGYEMVYQGRRCVFTLDGWLYDRLTLLVIAGKIHPDLTAAGPKSP